MLEDSRTLTLHFWWSPLPTVLLSLPQGFKKPLSPLKAKSQLFLPPRDLNPLQWPKGPPSNVSGKTMMGDTFKRPLGIWIVVSASTMKEKQSKSRVIFFIYQIDKQKKSCNMLYCKSVERHSFSHIADGSVNWNNSWWKICQYLLGLQIHIPLT